MSKSIYDFDEDVGNIIATKGVAGNMSVPYNEIHDNPKCQAWLDIHNKGANQDGVIMYHCDCYGNVVFKEVNKQLLIKGIDDKIDTEV